MIEANALASGSKPKPKEAGSEDVKPEPVAKKEGEAVNEQVAGPSRGGKNSGLRKVRLGAFEDTGRCKGYVLFPICRKEMDKTDDCRFAFLDFKSAEDATAALSHRGNKFFLGRRLILQVSLYPSHPLVPSSES